MKLKSQTKEAGDTDLIDTQNKANLNGDQVLHQKTKGQSRSRSLIESLVNILVGFGLATVANYVWLMWEGFDVNWNQMIRLGFWMTLLSIIRSYWLRRLFNWWDHR